MNKKGQIGKLITSLPVLLGIVFILAIFLAISFVLRGLIGPEKPTGLQDSLPDYVGFSPGANGGDFMEISVEFFDAGVRKIQKYSMRDFLKKFLVDGKEWNANKNYFFQSMDKYHENYDKGNENCVFLVYYVGKAANNADELRSFYSNYIYAQAIFMSYFKWGGQTGSLSPRKEIYSKYFSFLKNEILKDFSDKKGIVYYYYGGCR